MPPKVSVITALYNHEAYIGRAIESVLAQTYKDYELIVWDDGSTDGGLDVVRSYVRKDPRRVYSYTHSMRVNKGQEATRNEALKVASGEYICLLDSDDYWLPHKLEQQIALLEKEPQTGLVYAPLMVWIDGVGEMPLPSAHPLPSGHVFEQLIASNFIHACTVMFRRACIAGMNEPFSKNFKTIGEFPLWLKIAKSWGIAPVDKPVAVWRVHGNNTGSKHRELGRRELVQMTEGFLKDPHYAQFKTAIEGARDQYLYDLAVGLIEEGAGVSSHNEAAELFNKLSSPAEPHTAVMAKAKFMGRVLSMGTGAVKVVKGAKIMKNWLTNPRQAIFNSAIARSQLK